jgi:class 3 adenylate cyclase
MGHRPPATNHFNSRIFRGYLELVAQYGQSSKFFQLCTKNGFDPQSFYDENRWFSIEEERVFMRLIRQTIQDDNICHEAGRLGAHPHSLGAALHFTAKYLVSLHLLFKNVPIYSNILNRAFSLELLSESTNSYFFRMTPRYALLDDNQRTLLREALPDICNSIRGYWTALFQLKGIGEPIITFEISETDVEFNVAYSNSLKNRLINFLRSFAFFVSPVFLMAIVALLTKMHFATFAASTVATLFATAGLLLYSQVKESKTIAGKFDEQIKELQQTQNELRKQSEQNNLVSLFVQRLIQENEPSKLYSAISKNLKEIIGFDRVLVLIEEDEKIIAKSAIGPGADLFLSGFSLPTRIDSVDPRKLTNIFINKSEILIPDVATHIKNLDDPESVRLLKTSGSRSFACSAISTKNKSYGLLIADNVHARRALTNDDLSVLTTIARQIGIYLENIETSRKLTEIYKSTANAYSRFVPWKALELLGYKTVFDVKLGDFAELDVSVLFADIRDFTALCETMSPKDVIRFLNSYYNLVAPIIEQNGGIIDKFLGDGLMAIFDSADGAVEASMYLQKAIIDYNLGFRIPARRPIQVGIGLHKGRLVIGPVGYSDRLNITVVSDIVNTAARLDSLSKDLGADILVSGQLFAGLAKKNRITVDHGLQQIRGKDNAVSVVELIVDLSNYDTAILNEPSRLYLLNLQKRMQEKMKPKVKIA